MNKKFYITTPIYYVNGSPHIGHAYTSVACDALARFHRMLGEDVFFLTGTDEHGQKIQKTADEAGVPVQEFVDRIAPNFRKLWETLGVAYTDFIRTTDERHKRAVRAALTLVYEKGDIYASEYEGFYCTPCETFWGEEELKDGKCPDCGRPVELLKEKNYFFRMSSYRQWLIDYFKQNPDFVRPRNRYNEVLSFLENNELKDLCISRPKQRLSWGIELPFDTDYVAYVWFDALLNYLSALGWFEKEPNSSFWPADYHVIAKDILRQHAVIWPVMLKSLGIELPRCVYSHGWWMIEKDDLVEKMSKSRGNVVDPFVVVEQFGVDAFRYFLLREVPFGADGRFSWKALVTRTNSDLANDLGNLTYRTLNMLEKYYDGVIPAGDGVPIEEYRQPLENLYVDYGRAMEQVAFTDALDRVWQLVRAANKSIEDRKPWAMKKEGRDGELASFMYSLAETIRIAAAFLFPFMPGTAQSIYDQLGMPVSLAGVRLEAESVYGRLKAGVRIVKDKPLFPRIDVEQA